MFERKTLDMLNDIIDSVTLLASDDETANAMRCGAKARGIRVDGTTIWDGPCPDGSFMRIAPGVSMSTAEFYVLRKASEMSRREAILFIDEMCGLYETKLTNPYLADGELCILKESRTTKRALYEYLMPIRDTRQGSKVLDALTYAEDRLGGPIAARRSMRANTSR